LDDSRKNFAMVEKTRGERLRAARMKRFKSARSAALALAIPISTYGAHERAESPGGRDYGPDEARCYARYFGVTPEWLLMGQVQPAGDRMADEVAKRLTPKLRIMGYVGNGGQAHLYTVGPEDLEEVAVPMPDTRSMVGLEIRGKSVGRYFNRWLMLYQDLRRPLKPALVGHLCVVGLKDGRVFVKRLQKSRAEGQFDLVSDVGPPIRVAHIAWAAKVEAIIPR
jgi:hypothetical protein